MYLKNINPNGVNVERNSKFMQFFFFGNYQNWACKQDSKFFSKRNAFSACKT